MTILPVLANSIYISMARRTAESCCRAANILEQLILNRGLLCIRDFVSERLIFVPMVSAVRERCNW